MRLPGHVLVAISVLPCSVCSSKYIYNEVGVFRDTSQRRTVCFDGRTQCCVISVRVLVFGALWLDVVKWQQNVHLAI